MHCQLLTKDSKSITTTVSFEVARRVELRPVDEDELDAIGEYRIVGDGLVDEARQEKEDRRVEDELRGDYVENDSEEGGGGEDGVLDDRFYDAEQLPVITVSRAGGSNRLVSVQEEKAGPRATAAAAAPTPGLLAVALCLGVIVRGGGGGGG